MIFDFQQYFQFEYCGLSLMMICAYTKTIDKDDDYLDTINTNSTDVESEGKRADMITTNAVWNLFVSIFVSFYNFTIIIICDMARPFLFTYTAVCTYSSFCTSGSFIQWWWCDTGWKKEIKLNIYNWWSIRWSKLWL